MAAILGTNGQPKSGLTTIVSLYAHDSDGKSTRNRITCEDAAIVSGKVLTGVTVETPDGNFYLTGSLIEAICQAQADWMDC